MPLMTPQPMMPILVGAAKSSPPGVARPADAGARWPAEPRRGRDPVFSRWGDSKPEPRSILPRRRRSAGMASELGVMIIGAGRVSTAHARAVAQTPGATLAAIADVDRSRADAFAQKHGGQALADY